MTERGRRLSLTKSDLATAAGRELLELLKGLSADGSITREELERLRAWLEANRQAPIQAREFLTSVLDAIPRDGEVAPAELEALQTAIERVLPPDARFVAALHRKRRRAAQREQNAAERAAEREAKKLARERDRPLDRADFVIAGATRSMERREACERLDVGDTVLLEREPGNVEDDHAILVLNEDGEELGYVPRDDARRMAPLLDAGARAEATIKKLLEAREGYALPVVVSTLYRADASAAVSHVGARQAGSRRQPSPPGCGCSSSSLLLVFLFAASALAFCGGVHV
jgi:hypothetical protein